MTFYKSTYEEFAGMDYHEMLGRVTEMVHAIGYHFWNVFFSRKQSGELWLEVWMLLKLENGGFVEGGAALRCGEGLGVLKGRLQSSKYAMLAQAAGRGEELSAEDHGGDLIVGQVPELDYAEIESKHIASSRCVLESEPWSAFEDEFRG